MSPSANGSKEHTAQVLADAHFRVDTGLLHVIRLHAVGDCETHEDEPIKLLEVNEDTPRNGIVPVYFGADPAHGIAHASVIVEIAPDEYAELRAGRLKLPDGWIMGEEITPSAAVKD